MTIAMAAFAGEENIVTVSDARLSYGEMVPAEDGATMKSRRIADKWGVMFAADDATAFSPVVDNVIEALLDFEPDNEVADKKKLFDHTYEVVSKTVREKYENEFGERFFRTHLARFGYASISEFRQSGFTEMGKDLYHQYSMELAKFDLGLELLGYGFSGAGIGFIFEVANPGKIILHNLRGFAAIGSGSLMALAALNRRPKSHRIPDTIYRLLDAKFSSETARDVGKTTYVLVLKSNGNAQIMKPEAIEDLRKIWDGLQSQPSPKKALDIIRDDDAYSVLAPRD